MAHFPDSVMPKKLAKETNLEVDGNPSIYNAKDYNLHHREILAIEKFIIDNGGIEDTMSKLEDLFASLTGGGLITRLTGILSPGAHIILPSHVIHTRTVGNLSTTATSVTVSSTAGFQPSGYFTRMSPMRTDYNSYIGTNSSKMLTFQEVVKYSGISGNIFTGCERSQLSTIAQNIGETCTVIAGRASLMFTPLSMVPLDTSIKKVDRISVQCSGVMDNALFAAIGATDVPLHWAAGYSLVIVGQMPKIDLSGVSG